MRALNLNLNSEWFEDIKSGKKTEEYRNITDYWKKRIEGRTYDLIIIKKGYPKRDDYSRQLVFKYSGYEKKTIVHKHFNNIPTEVYAIKLGKNVTEEVFGEY